VNEFLLHTLEDKKMVGVVDVFLSLVKDGKKKEEDLFHEMK
jgi:hypothetical protein